MKTFQMGSGESQAASGRAAEREWVGEFTGETEIREKASQLSEKEEGELKILLVKNQDKLNRAERDITDLGNATSQSEFVTSELNRAEREKMEAGRDIAALEMALAFKKLEQN